MEAIAAAIKPIDFKHRQSAICRRCRCSGSTALTPAARGATHRDGARLRTRTSTEDFLAGTMSEMFEAAVQYALLTRSWPTTQILSSFGAHRGIDLNRRTTRSDWVHRGQSKVGLTPSTGLSTGAG